jgi:hypothetical protein
MKQCFCVCSFYATLTHYKPSFILSFSKSLNFQTILHCLRLRWLKALRFSLYCFLFLFSFLLRSPLRNLKLRNLFLHWITLTFMTLLPSMISSSLSSMHHGMIRFWNLFMWFFRFCWCLIHFVLFWSVLFVFVLL